MVGRGLAVGVGLGVGTKSGLRSVRRAVLRARRRSTRFRRGRGGGERTAARWPTGVPTLAHPKPWVWPAAAAWRWATSVPVATSVSQQASRVRARRGIVLWRVGDRHIILRLTLGSTTPLTRTQSLVRRSRLLRRSQRCGLAYTHLDRRATRETDERSGFHFYPRTFFSSSMSSAAMFKHHRVRGDVSLQGSTRTTRAACGRPISVCSPLEMEHNVFTFRCEGPNGYRTPSSRHCFSNCRRS